MNGGEWWMALAVGAECAPLPINDPMDMGDYQSCTGAFSAPSISQHRRLISIANIQVLQSQQE
jgi:hypothetical protein